MTVKDETCRGQLQGHLLPAGHFLQDYLVQRRQDLRDCYLVTVRHVHSANMVVTVVHVVSYQPLKS